MVNLSTLKTLFLTIVFMLLGCLAIQAQVVIFPPGDLGLKWEVKLEEAGTLPDQFIIDDYEYKISELKIIGEINGTDLRLIREIARKPDRDSNITGGKLSVLDLSEARIVKGGAPYYYNRGDRTGYYTAKDEIGDYAFYECDGLTSLLLPSRIIKIGKSAFSGCNGLTSLTLPSDITGIGDYAFSGCNVLTSLNLPSGITKIGKGTFDDCHALTSLTLPTGITEIGDGAFSGCNGLTSLTLPTGITKIGDYTLYV